MTVRCMRFLCLITKATDKHSEYVILITVSRFQCLNQRASMLRSHVHCLSVSLTLALDGTELSDFRLGHFTPGKRGASTFWTSLLVQKHSNFMRDYAVTTVIHSPLPTVSCPRQLKSSSAPPKNPNHRKS